MKKWSIGESPEVFKTDGMVGKKILDEDNFEVIFLTIEPGEILEKHALPVKVRFIVKNGKGVALTDQGNIEVKKDDILELPKDIKRGWENNGKVLLELIVIKDKE